MRDFCRFNLYRRGPSFDSAKPRPIAAMNGTRISSRGRDEVGKCIYFIIRKSAVWDLVAWLSKLIQGQRICFDTWRREETAPFGMYFNLVEERDVSFRIDYQA